jgi:MSHA biogenesis protein MshK
MLIFCMLIVSPVFAVQYLDPTRPPGATILKQLAYPIAKPSGWLLSSTLIASERKLATINGKIVRKGERVNGAVLVDVQALNVTLRKNNKKFKVFMFNKVNVIKKRR